MTHQSKNNSDKNLGKLPRLKINTAKNEENEFLEADENAVMVLLTIPGTN